jgi:hypothetical protein
MADDEGEEFIEIALPPEGDGASSLEYELFSKITQQDIEKRDLENQWRFLQNASFKDDNQQRKDYYKKSHAIIQAWIGFLMVLIFSQFLLRPFGYSLEKEEFIAVVVSLSGSVFGFWYLVGQYLFEPKRSKKDDKAAY